MQMVMYAATLGMPRWALLGQRPNGPLVVLGVAYVLWGCWRAKVGA